MKTRGIFRSGGDKPGGRVSGYPLFNFGRLNSRHFFLFLLGWSGACIPIAKRIGEDPGSQSSVLPGLRRGDADHRPYWWTGRDRSYSPPTVAV